MKIPTFPIPRKREVWRVRRKGRLITKTVGRMYRRWIQRHGLEFRAYWVEWQRSPKGRYSGIWLRKLAITGQRIKSLEEIQAEEEVWQKRLRMIDRWTDNGFLVSDKGTEYVVQRECMNGAQAGGWIYYLLRRRKGESELNEVREIDTQRTKEAPVRRIAERLVIEEENAGG